MILEVFGLFILFVATLGLLPLMVYVFWLLERSKRAIIEGMAQLDVNLRNRLGWAPEEYISIWNIAAPFRLGWQAWGELSQKQALVLQRVLMHGLPEFAGIPDEVRKAVRTYRCCFGLIFAVGAVLVFLPAHYSLSHKAAELTGWPAIIWFTAFGLAVCPLFFLPSQKFRKWPAPEEIK
ncbi:hypothetical protein [Ruegeria faecimaris]|uniref:Uncharacterized protein n=1 Tax=Ruegeria faecimaris TaxID=686389 RepID=A0A521C534_9RHOB|nr:hypothetical protein [Ruegeria faecimaris]SMO53941.1 hypothetical protein SAMN06265380_102112 [Ruegeria faecimaris]